MGFLQIVLAAVAVVGAFYTGGATLGLLAGGVVAVSLASQQGWLGGSMKNFFNSGWGKGLTMAASIACVATAAAGAMSTAADTSAVASNADTAAAAGSSDLASAGAGAGAGTGAAAGVDAGVNASGIPNALALEGAPEGTVSGFMAQNMTGGAQYAATLANSSPEAVSEGLTAGDVASANQALDSAWINSGAPGVGAPAEPTAVTQAAGNLGVSQSASTAAMNATNATASAVNPTANATAGEITPVNDSAGLNTGANTAAAGQHDINAIDAAPSASPSGVGGFLSKAGDAINKNPGLAVVGGSLLSGVANGMAQQRMLQEQIAAQNWGNLQWNDPAQIASLQSAAAAPITVPQGYLARAQAVRNLMTGATPQQGPVVGPQPNGNGAPNPYPIAPPGPNSTAPGGGPVPLSAMGSTPRGGMG